MRFMVLGLGGCSLALGIERSLGTEEHITIPAGASSSKGVVGQTSYAIGDN